LQVDVRPWHRWFIDYYAISELNGSLQPSPPPQATLQAELDRIFVPQANLGFTLTNEGSVPDHYDVSHDDKLHVGLKGPGLTCFLGWPALGSSDPSCTNDTELTPMYHRLIDSQRLAAGQSAIDLDNQDMFYLLFFKEFDKNNIGGWSSTQLIDRRLPSVVHTNYTDFPDTLLNHDRFIAVASAHEIAHKLGRFGPHYDPTDANAVYLMVSPMSIVPSILNQRHDDKKYPCRLGRKDWNMVNYVYPTPR
jgi:hypothetical protein